MAEPLSLAALLLWTLVTATLLLFFSALYRLVIKRHTTLRPTSTAYMPIEQLTPTDTFRSLTVDVEHARTALEHAKLALFNGDHAGAVVNAVEAFHDIFRQLLRQYGVDEKELSLSDMAHLLRIKGVKINLIETASKLNSLRLRVVVGQAIARDDAVWAVSACNALVQRATEVPV